MRDDPTQAHHNIVVRYFVLSFVAALVWVSLLVLIDMERRTQGLLSQTRGLQFFSDIGTFRVLSFGLPGIMTVLAVMPVLFAGFGHLLLPKGVGIPDRTLSKPAFWLLVAAVCLVPVTVFVPFGGLQPPTADAGGWAIYAPLRESQSAPSSWLVSSAMVLVLALGLAYLSLMLTAVGFVMTVFRSVRAGTRLAQLQPCVWLYLVAALLVLVLLPIEGVELSLVWIESYRRSPGFFDPAGGGEWLQHILASQPPWPVMLLPALAVASAAASASAGRPVVLAPLIAVASPILGLGSLALAGEPFVHQSVGATYHVVASAALGTGLLLVLLAWIATLSAGRWRLVTPALWVAGFAILLPVGVVVDWSSLSVPPDATALFYRLVNMSFVVSVAAIFALSAGWYAFHPEITGRRPVPALGMLQFLFAFAGAALVLAYSPYPLGGMPAIQVVDRAAASQAWLPLLGIYLAEASVVFFVLGLAFARKQQAAAGASG
jgi:cytochrome c oxidase subunit I+III